MTHSEKFMREVFLSCWKDRPKQLPSEWCVENLNFDEAGNHGAFKTDGCEYIVEPLNDFAINEITDEIMVFGSQTKKTGTIMGGVAWSLVNDPCGFLWVMPSIGLARKFSKQRFRKLLRKSEGLKSILATCGRFDFSTLEMMIGSSTLNFVGSNSPANLASNPCRRVILDEVDKFDTGGEDEADAVNLADQRTKDQPNPQRWKTSTPTTEAGLIWQEFLKGDQRRYFIPCPHCKKLVVLIWSKEYTVFKIRGDEAIVRWDDEARREDKSWDYARVEQSARAVCPFCAGHIRDEHKPYAVKNGIWQPTAIAPKHFRSRHLPSLYANSHDTSFGALAVKFLQAKNSIQGVQGFVNGDLAEPKIDQQTRVSYLENIITVGTELPEGATPMMLADFQLLAPYIWYLVLVVTPKSIRIMDCGSLDNFEQMDDKQKEWKIPNHLVSIDCGHAPEKVFAACLEKQRGKFCPAKMGEPHVWVGWMPMRGDTEREEFYSQSKSKKMLPYIYGAAMRRPRFTLPKINFLSSHLKHLLKAMRKSETIIELEFCLEEKKLEELLLHLNSEYLKTELDKRGRKVQTWYLKSGNPNHLLDCLIEGLAKTMFHNLIPYEQMIQTKPKNKPQPK